MTDAGYDPIAEQYIRTNMKPDKRFSIAPTILKMVGIVRNKTILDAGCGNGIFTRTLACDAWDVYGWDVSGQQLRIAKEMTPLTWPNVHYQEKNIFTDELPRVDIINAPFVINYARSVEELEQLMVRCYAALKSRGKLVGVVDLPSGQNLGRYGAKKRLLGPAEDGTPIEITVFDSGGEEICTLPSLARYYKKETLEVAARKAGFSVSWQPPLVHPKGIEMYGAEFWKGYTDNPELGYMLARKSRPPE
ncbi:MAG: type 11 methyltransferase [Candidatus Berkelbacteria bacterium Gr01-1014_85]|uniref:Type 11 methyltransferase n=1 Tax=Candidatus Berkelbacteria bacterium Gr01-1014_85 TaxID=2017150 RepID=A0A554JAU6_9BACT|nr:MAG: type 11 methyltransferase [Candidatus Berkelbacteria bacterium Gr01-1014_85]